MTEIFNNSIQDIPALKVNQWLKYWNEVQFNNEELKSEPEHFFYLFSISAVHLKKLSGIGRRTTEEGLPRSQDIGIQRRHDVGRSIAINKYVFFGSPYSELTQSQKNVDTFNNLKKPGWLPTAIVVNILKPGDKRKNNQILDVDDSISIEKNGESTSKIVLPKNYITSNFAKNWNPKSLYPIEIIDGQHRLWAFEDDSPEYQNFQLPVVAYYGLDIGWQAYLFWMINIKPKKINTSLAFDLYPLLRTQDWLEADQSVSVYRETRAQELTESFWSNPHSPWYHRINMLGDIGQKGIITQAGWIRSLLATFIKNTKGQSNRIGGLYGSTLKNHDVLPWDRAQQAAFIISIGQQLNEKLKNSSYSWAEGFQSNTNENIQNESKIHLHTSFTSPLSLLNTDIGNRVFLHIVNDLFFVRIDELELTSWWFDENYGATDEEAVIDYIESVKKTPKIIAFIDDLTSQLAKYDWRTFAASGLSEDEKLRKSTFRGGPGYKSMRMHLLKHIITQSGPASEAAQDVYSIIGDN